MTKHGASEDSPQHYMFVALPPFPADKAEIVKQQLAIAMSEMHPTPPKSRIAAALENR